MLQSVPACAVGDISGVGQGLCGVTSTASPRFSFLFWVYFFFFRAQIEFNRGINLLSNAPTIGLRELFNSLVEVNRKALQIELFGV